MSSNADPHSIQLPLSGIDDDQYEEIMFDHGPVGGTASQPHYVEAANGQEYLVKGPSLTPHHPEVGTNEYLTAQLAQLLGLPILDHRLLRLGTDVYFASAWMTQGTFYPSTTEDLFNRSKNRDMVYLLAPFDCWVANVDRHNSNLLVRQHIDKRGGGEILTLLPNDHGHCLMAPGINAANLATSRLRLTASQCVILPFVRSAITDFPKLETGVKAIEKLDETLIRFAIKRLPRQWIDDNGRELLFEFLLDRRESLRSLLNADRANFPALQGGGL